MEVLLGPMRPSVARAGGFYVPAERRRDETNEKKKEKSYLEKGGMKIGRGREKRKRRNIQTA